jgi:hypothetical protein
MTTHARKLKQLSLQRAELEFKALSWSWGEVINNEP